MNEVHSTQEVLLNLKMDLAQGECYIDISVRAIFAKSHLSGI